MMEDYEGMGRNVSVRCGERGRGGSAELISDCGWQGGAYCTQGAVSVRWSRCLSGFATSKSSLE